MIMYIKSRSHAQSSYYPNRGVSKFVRLLHDHDGNQHVSSRQMSISCQVKISQHEVHMCNG